MDCPTTPGLLQTEAVARAASMTLIAECNRGQNTCALSAAFHMTFGQSPTAIAAVAGNMKYCDKEMKIWRIGKIKILNF